MDAIKVYMASPFFVTKLAPRSPVFSPNTSAHMGAEWGMSTDRYLSAHLRLKRAPTLPLRIDVWCYHDEN